MHELHYVFPTNFIYFNVIHASGFYFTCNHVIYINVQSLARPYEQYDELAVPLMLFF